MNTNLKSSQTSKKNSYSFEPISNYISSIPNTLNQLVYGTGKNISSNSIPQLKTKSKSQTKLKTKTTQNNIENIETLNNISNISSSLNKSNIPIETILTSPLETTKITDLLTKNKTMSNKTKTNIKSNLVSNNLNETNYQSLTNNLTPIETLEQPLLKTKSQEPNILLNYILNISFSTWIIIILILALLGINIFNYLAQGTQFTSSLITSILQYFGLIAIDSTKQIASTTELGIKTTIDKIKVENNKKENKEDKYIKTNEITETTPTVQQSQLISNQNNYQEIQKENELEYMQKSELEKALNDAKFNVQNQEYETDKSKSSIQNANNKGWCYIGLDNGLRTCSKIGVNDVCMSGDIYPTQEVCINPNLRI